MITNLFSLNLSDHYLFCSKVVGVVLNVTAVSENIYYGEGDILCSVCFLGVEYSVTMESAGYIKKIYIEECNVVEYNSPMFLFECCG